MRSRRWILFLFAFLIAGVVSCHDHSPVFSNRTTVVGSGLIVEHEFPVAGFDSFTFSSEGEVHLEQGLVEEVRVEADDNIIPYLEVRVVGSTLEITTASNIELQPSRTMDFYVTTPALENLMFAGVGGVDCSSLDGTHLSLTLAGVGGMDFGGLSLETLDADLTGVGNFTVEGVAAGQDVLLQGVGSYDAQSLTSHDAALTVNGQGSATVRVSDNLNVTINGSGSVFYIGNPAVTSTINGTGTVLQLSP